MNIRADARALPLAEGCVQCVVTSPPYWGLRDYGTGNQIGLEPTPAAYVASLVSVFAELLRVLRDDGTVWLNLGDSYAGGGNYRGLNSENTLTAKQRSNRGATGVCQLLGAAGKDTGPAKPKDLVGIPWRVAFALQAAGWYLRSDIIWSKPNPMPESVKDRPTKAHEYLFLLSKNERYHYDADAIREEGAGRLDFGRMKRPEARMGEGGKWARDNGCKDEADGRNKRSVWTIPTMPYAGAHFATMPEALVEPCILAGCPLGGLVLDPFIGSGTVGAVAERLGRRWVGTDLAYQGLAQARTLQRGFRFEAAVGT